MNHNAALSLNAHAVPALTLAKVLSRANGVRAVQEATRTAARLRRIEFLLAQGPR